MTQPADAQPDTNFYDLIQQLAKMIGTQQNRERRRWPRRTYRVIQRIAPWAGSGFPKEAAFFEVACRDLSRSGFSFFCPAPPDFNRVVVELGVPPDVTYLLADVLHHEQVLLSASGEVRSAWSAPGAEGARAEAPQGTVLLYLIGCRFMRRLRKPNPTYLGL